jgi:hypothetical protein
MLALPRSAPQHSEIVVAATEHRVRHPHLQRAEHRHHAVVGYAFLLADLLHQVLLVDHPWQIPHFPPPRFGQPVGLATKPLGQPFGERQEVFHRHANTLEPCGHTAFRLQQPKRPTEPYSIKTAKHP